MLRMRKRLEPGRTEASTLLERYDRDYETDFELASCAAEVATEVLRLSGGSSVPVGLVNVISFETVSPPQIPTMGKRILDAVSKWEELAPGLSSIIALDALQKANTVVYRRRWLDAGRDQAKALLGKYDNASETNFDAVEQALKVAADVIQLVGQLPVPASLVRLTTQPTTVTSDLAAVGSRILDTFHEWEASARGVNGLIPDALPGTTLSLAQSALANIEQWAQSLLFPLAGLCELVDVVLAPHRNPGSADLSVLYADLGKRFRGIDTVWTDILAAIEWTRRIREIFGQRQMSERLVQWATLAGDQTPPVKGLVAHHSNFEEKLSAAEWG